MATEKRLIDANRLLRETRFQEVRYPHDDLKKDIENAPTVDAVEVVRCKDCKHWSYISGLDKEPRCTVFCGLHSKAYPTDPDDYCSYGERKDNGAE